jgi:hypothetical protein
MAAQAIHQFAECITCHAWSPDHSSNALLLPPPSSLDLTVLTSLRPFPTTYGIRHRVRLAIVGVEFGPDS